MFKNLRFKKLLLSLTSKTFIEIVKKNWFKSAQIVLVEFSLILVNFTWLFFFYMFSISIFFSFHDFNSLKKFQNVKLLEFFFIKSLQAYNMPICTQKIFHAIRDTWNLNFQYLFTWIFHVFFRNNWEAFHAQTNVFWLHYLADKLIRAKRYKRNTKKDQGLLREFRNFAKDMLEHTSACDLISSSDFFTSWPTVFIPQDQMFIIIYMYFMKIVFIL